jgi:hypothetical protein
MKRLLTAVLCGTLMFSCTPRKFNDSARQNSSVDDSLGAFLSAHYNPYSEKKAAIGDWGLARIEPILGRSEGQVHLGDPVYVVVQRKEGAWSLVKDDIKRVTVADLESLGVPQKIATALYEKVEYGTDTNEGEIYRLLSANYNPYSSKIVYKGSWGLAAIETLIGRTEGNLRTTPASYVVLRKEAGTWAIKKDELKSLTVGDLESLGIPNADAQWLVARIQQGNVQP